MLMGIDFIFVATYFVIFLPLRLIKALWPTYASYVRFFILRDLMNQWLIIFNFSISSEVCNKI